MNLGLDHSITHALHQQDPDRFWCLIPIEADKRPAVAALLALNQELGRIPEQVSQPMAGFIRLQWWREAVEEAQAGRPRRQPLAMALPTILAAGLPAEALLGLIDARERELDEEPMADLAELEGHARATAGNLQCAVATITGGDLDRAVRIGTAYGLIGILRATGHLARRSRFLLPNDLLQHHGVKRDDLLAGQVSPGLRRVAEEVVGAAQAGLAGLRARRGEAATPLLLIARHEAREIRRLDFDPYRAAEVARPSWLALRLLALQTVGF